MAAPDHIAAGFDHGAEAPRFIVAEVSKNWPGDEDDLLSMRFEEVINVNLKRGYCLLSWKLNRVASEGGLNETIVAIFEKM